MILLDPDLEPDSAPNETAAKKTAASGPDKARKIPSVRTLSRFLTEAQAAVRLKGEVTVLLTTDTAIRKLNRQFRGKNKATDVLSFPAEGLGAEGYAGDLAVSVPTALRQAIEQGHSLSTEIKVLILHGLLHLAGYDHEADQGKMARRERQLRARLALPQGLIERATSRPSVNSSTNAGCPILSRSLRKGGKPQTSTSERVPQPSLLRPEKPQTPIRSRSSRP
jgi:probable rRNA maturation factor